MRQLGPYLVALLLLPNIPWLSMTRKVLKLDGMTSSERAKVEAFATRERTRRLRELREVLTEEQAKYDAPGDGGGTDGEDGGDEVLHVCLFLLLDFNYSFKFCLSLKYFDF